MHKLLRTLSAWLVPLARRVYVEAGLIVMATMWQLLRLSAVATNWWRRRKALRALRDAQEALGRRLYEMGLGEQRFRVELARLEEQILNQQAAGAGSGWLRIQRRGLLIRLAEPMLAVPVPPAGAEAVHTAAQLAWRHAGEQQARYLDALRCLIPSQAVMRLRVAVGLVMLLLAVYLIWPSGTASPSASAPTTNSTAPSSTAALHAEPQLEPRAWRRLGRGQPPAVVTLEELSLPATGRVHPPAAHTSEAERAPITLAEQPDPTIPSETAAAALPPQGGFSALHAAAREGDMPQLETLLNAAADPNQADDRGITALHLAAFFGHEQAARLLIEHGARLDVRDQQQRTPLYYALCGRQAELVHYLLECGAEAALADRTGWNAPALAVHLDNPKLLALCARNTPRALRMPDGSTLLHLCAQWNRPAAARYLLEQKLVPATAVDGRGRTPLHVAAGCGATDVLLSLLQHSDTCDEWDDFRCTPLHYAAAGSARAAVLALLERGAEVNAASVAGDTPLHFAAAFAEEAVIDTLFAHGAAARAVNRLGDNPLHAAAYQGNRHALLALLRRLPRLARAENRAGHTPLHLAAARGHLAAVELLLQHGATVDARDRRNGTPLHLAAWAGHLKVAEVLLRAGADLNALADYNGGATPLDLAFAARRRELVRRFRAQGARLASER
jgi:cytohesin